MLEVFNLFCLFSLQLNLQPLLAKHYEIGLRYTAVHTEELNYSSNITCVNSTLRLCHLFLRPQITPVDDFFLNYFCACILNPVPMRWGGVCVCVCGKITVKYGMQNLPGSPNSLESISSFCCSSFSLSFFCFFSISLFLSSSCSPSNITLNALSSASYSSVRFFSNVLRLSTWFSNASSAEGGGQTPKKKEN